MRLRGSFRPSGDKSISHRIALLSLLAEGECRVENYATAVDTATTLEAVQSLGGEIQTVGNHLLFQGMKGRISQSLAIQCANSGTTMRLVMGILAGLDGDFVLDGDSSLRRRPMERVAKPLRRMGAWVACTDGKPPVRVRGSTLTGIHYTLPVPSAQLKSAVLLAGIQAQGTTMVLEPILSRDHTERLLVLSGANIRHTRRGWRVERSAPVMPETLEIPGDLSSAAFLLSGAAILPGSDVIAQGVLLNPTRTGFLDVLRRMGAQVEMETHDEEPEPWGTIRARYSPELFGCEVKAHEIPCLVDEVPILALVATQAQGTTLFHGVGELRIKESDRLASIIAQLGAMGGRLHVDGDDLFVEGPTVLRSPGTLESYGDHRIAMTLRIAGLLADSEPRIEEEECVEISYPGFHDTLRNLIT